MTFHAIQHLQSSVLHQIQAFLQHKFTVRVTTAQRRFVTNLLSLISVTLTSTRFGLSAGKSGQVITLNPDWVAGTVNVEVII